MMSCSKVVNNSDRETFEAIVEWFAPIIKNAEEIVLFVNDNNWFVL